jgi:hypothetical protein
MRHVDDSTRRGRLKSPRRLYRKPSVTIPFAAQSPGMAETVSRLPCWTRRKCLSTFIPSKAVSPMSGITATFAFLSSKPPKRIAGTRATQPSVVPLAVLKVSRRQQPGSPAALRSKPMAAFANADALAQAARDRGQAGAGIHDETGRLRGHRARHFVMPAAAKPQFQRVAVHHLDRRAAPRHRHPVAGRQGAQPDEGRPEQRRQQPAPRALPAGAALPLAHRAGGPSRRAVAAPCRFRAG